MDGKDNSAKTPGPRVARIELTPVFVPFRELVRQTMEAAGGLGMAIEAEEAWLGGDYVICKLIADDGSAGLGEDAWLGSGVCRLDVQGHGLKTPAGEEGAGLGR